jgi:tRNA (mo5U34)-methyltransferase
VNITLDNFFTCTESTSLNKHHPALRSALKTHFENRLHGKTQEWDLLLAGIPEIDSGDFTFEEDCINVSLPSSYNLDTGLFKSQLEEFKPWRKGPWNLLGVEINTEWRSDWKWKRLQPHMTPLSGRRVLDIGTGNGYFLYRMLGDGADLAVGIDPTRIFLYQFEVVQKLLADNNAHLLPLRSEHLPGFNFFDTVFSLGVLYHRRSPVDHITELLSFVRDGGEVILETLVVPGDKETILVPRDRYAKMANVWFLPSTAALENLLHRAGLVNIRTVDVNQTSTSEQRTTEWMDFQSLSDFLYPDDLSLTYEGYPAPRRAIVIANKPGN